MTPFVVIALPRSRSYWLSRFLSYGSYECGHDQARYVRSIDDVKAWLAQNFTGTAETAAAPWWRLIRGIRPDAKILVVRRPVQEVVDSLMRLDLKGIGTFKRDILTREMERIDRCLNRIEREPNVLSVRFHDLVDEAVCRAVFEFCLPYCHDHDRWQRMAGQNLQGNMAAEMRYCLAFQPILRNAAHTICRQMRRELGARRSSTIECGDVTFQEESLERFWADAQPLFAEHCAAVGEEEGNFLNKNRDLFARLEAAGAWQIVTARSNGRMFGYLCSIVGPSLENAKTITATQTTFFASKDAAGMGLGLKLQKAAIAFARNRGVSEIYMRAGTRGSGPKMGALYRRLGAEPSGQQFKISLGAA
jgi:GNAT superfamily N-acetyltransferase